MQIVKAYCARHGDAGMSIIKGENGTGIACNVGKCEASAFIPAPYHGTTATCWADGTWLYGKHNECERED